MPSLPSSAPRTVPALLLSLLDFGASSSESGRLLNTALATIKSALQGMWMAQYNIQERDHIIIDYEQDRAIDPHGKQLDTTQTTQEQRSSDIGFRNLEWEQ